MAESITLARPYAKAAFEFASGHQSIDEWSLALELLTKVTKDDAMQGIIQNPSLTSVQKAAVISDVCGEQLNEPTKNFVTLVAENNRLNLISEIAELFEIQKRLRNQSVDVEVITAFDLQDEQQELLVNVLTNKLERKVNIKASTDKSILGGVVIYTEDQHIDVSIRGRLMKLAEAINS